MKPGIMIYIAGISLTSAVFVSYVVYIFWGSRKAGEQKLQSLTSEEKKEKSEKKSFINQSLIFLSENPQSKESTKVKIYASAIMFFAVLVLSGKIIFSFLAAAGVFFGIGQYFQKQKDKKKGLFDDQLIEALSMITNSVRAGQSLMQAMENMVKDTKEPVSTVFAAALRKVKLGVPVNQALSEMAEDIKSKDLKIVVTSINLARETGGNLGDILSLIAETMRERNKIRGKINSLTAQGRMSGMVMGMVPFILLAVLYFIEPEMMGLLFTTLLGNIMLTIAVIMVALGMFIIGKIVNIDV